MKLNANQPSSSFSQNSDGSSLSSRLSSLSSGQSNVSTRASHAPSEMRLRLGQRPGAYAAGHGHQGRFSPINMPQLDPEALDENRFFEANNGDISTIDRANIEETIMSPTLQQALRDLSARRCE